MMTITVEADGFSTFSYSVEVNPMPVESGDQGK